MTKSDTKTAAAIFATASVLETGPVAWILMAIAAFLMAQATLETYDEVKGDE